MSRPEWLFGKSDVLAQQAATEAPAPSGQHFQKAEQVLAKAVRRRFGSTPADPDLLVEAHVRAILAVAEALRELGASEPGGAA